MFGGNSEISCLFKKLEDTNDFYYIQQFFTEKEQIQLVLKLKNLMKHYLNNNQDIAQYSDLLAHRLSLNQSPEYSYGSSDDNESEFIRINPLIQKDLLIPAEKSIKYSNYYLKGGNLQNQNNINKNQKACKTKKRKNQDNLLEFQQNHEKKIKSNIYQEEFYQNQENLESDDQNLYLSNLYDIPIDLINNENSSNKSNFEMLKQFQNEQQQIYSISSQIKQDSPSQQKQAYEQIHQQKENQFNHEKEILIQQQQTNQTQSLNQQTIIKNCKRNLSKYQKNFKEPDEVENIQKKKKIYEQ